MDGRRHENGNNIENNFGRTRDSPFTKIDLVTIPTHRSVNDTSLLLFKIFTPSLVEMTRLVLLAMVPSG
jgi:hypothetical protein